MTKTTCECKTLKGTQCKKTAKKGETKCHLHLKTPSTQSRKFLSRFSTLIHALSEDISKRIPIFHIECDENKCYYCKETLDKYTRTRDHIVNLVENSWFNNLTNLTNATVPCCRGCNQKFGKKSKNLPFQITTEYKFEREDELRALVIQLKDVMQKIQEIITSSRIYVK